MKMRKFMYANSYYFANLKLLLLETTLKLLHF
jgi:hypothetical protein